MTNRRDPDPGLGLGVRATELLLSFHETEERVLVDGERPFQIRKLLGRGLVFCVRTWSREDEATALEFSDGTVEARTWIYRAYRLTEKGRRYRELAEQLERRRRDELAGRSA